MQKTFTVLLLAASLAASASAATPLSALPRLRQSKTVLKAPTGSIWKAGKEEMFTSDDNNGWVLVSTKVSTYTPQGYVATSSQQVSDPDGQSLGYMRETYNYANPNQYFTELIQEQSFDGSTWTPTEKTTRTYDSRLPDVITDNTVQAFEEGTWRTTGNSYRRTITRNADGNIVSSIISVPYQGEYEETDRTILTYGADGKPHTILHEVRVIDEEDNIVWETDTKMFNIEWERFDGQIYTIDDIPSATNAPKVCTVEVEDINPTYHFTYPDLKGSFVGTGSVMIEGANATFTTTHTVLDDYGSFEQSSEIIYKMGPFTNSEGSTERLVNDPYGLTLEYYAADSSDGAIDVYQDIKGTVTYDDKLSVPTEYILTQLNAETNQRENMLRVLFSNYIDAAGLTEVGTTTDAPCYDLQGRRLPRPSGLYIQNNRLRH